MEAERYLVVLSSSKSKGTAEVAVSSKALEDLTKMQAEGLISFNIISDNFGRILAFEDTSKGKVLPRASATFSSFMDFSQVSPFSDQPRPFCCESSLPRFFSGSYCCKLLV
ncbi:uncharacterized protein LOC135195482 [Macrobrachium nipponense]|uniref:uncharacterized protein LOC135195482 n=1 Tax=Macrobrachium nipponense TaxID=159736 RepID=UPI0030C885AA